MKSPPTTSHERATHGMPRHAPGPIEPDGPSTDEGRDLEMEHCAELSFQDLVERVVEDSANVHCTNVRAGSASNEAAACSLQGMPERTMRILQTLLYRCMHDRYDILECFDRQIQTLIGRFCRKAVAEQGPLKALSAENVKVFMQAMHDHRHPGILRDKE